MPRVESYLRKTSGSPILPSARVQAPGDGAAYGAGVGAAVSNIGDLLHKRSLQYQEEQDRNMLIQGKADLDAWANNVLYNPDKDENNVPVGLMYRKGLQADGISETFGTQFKDEAERISSTMKTPRQQNLFREYAKGQSPGYFNITARHQVAQKDVAAKQAADTGNLNAKRLAVADPENQDTFNFAVDTIKRNNASVYGHLGAETIELKNQDDISNIREEQITSLLSQDKGLEAEMMYKNVKDQIIPEKRDNILSLINRISMPQKGQIIADQLYDKYGLMNESAAMEDLKQTYGHDTKLYSAASSLLQANYVDGRRFRNQEIEQAKENIILSVFEAKSYAEAVQLLKFSGLPPSFVVPMLQREEAKWKRLASANLTEDDKEQIKYERGGGFRRDLEFMREKQELTLFGYAELKPEQNTKYNLAGARITKFMEWNNKFEHSLSTPTLGMGGLRVAELQMSSSSDISEQQQQQNAAEYDRQFRRIRKEYPNKTEQEIYEFMTEVYK